MAAFGISFPKLALCRSTTSKADTNSVLTTTSTSTSTTTAIGAQTLALSIKNVPSQPLHYDVSTTTTTTAVPKKKTTSIATILAIDGETKQMPRTLSVFNELQLDDEVIDIDEKKRQKENSSDIIVPSSLSSMEIIDHHSDSRILSNNDSKKNLHNSNDNEKQSNHTFTPPTSSLSNDSLTNDLHVNLSTISVDLPQLKYAIEKFLVNDDDPIYQIAEEFSSGWSHFYQDHNKNIHSSNVTTSDFKHYENYKIDNTEFNSIYEKNTNNENISSHSPIISNNMKWYVSELRINRPLIYRTKCIYGQQYSNNRKLSQSVNDLKQIYNIINCPKNGKYKLTTEKINKIAYSTLSLQSFNNQQQFYSQSDNNILLNNNLSYTDDNLNNFYSDEDDQNLSPLIIQKTLAQTLNKNDTLIRNESVKKKLFDILNDDELENACIEDMSQEFEKISLTNHHHHIPIINSISSSDDEAFYSSPSNELNLPIQVPPPLSSSYNENLSLNMNNTTEHYLGRSRLITTSLDKIPMNNNNNKYDHPSSPCLLRPTYEYTRPSWYTSPLPQWRIDDQLPISTVLKRPSLKLDDHINNIDSNQLFKTKSIEYDIKENKYNYHHAKDQKHVSYSLMNTSTSLVDDSTPILPLIQDKSSNLLMFI